MPSDPVAPKSAFTTNKYKHPRSKALKDGIVKLYHDQALKTDTIDIIVPVHDKLKAYVDTKPKDEPWSPYTMKNTDTSALGDRHKL